MASELFTMETFAHACSGAAAGSCAMTVFYPMDLLRTHLQTASHVDENGVERKRSALETLRFLIERDGLESLYQGLAPTLASLWASNFVYFYAYNMAKIWWREKYGRAPHVGENLAIAAGAGVVNVMTTCPLWVANTRLKLQSKKGGSRTYDGLVDALTSIAREEGVLALWNGCTASLWLVSNPTINFVTYDQIKLRWLRAKGADSVGSLSAVELFCISMLAKAVATFVTYPVQLTQTKLRGQQRAAAAQAAGGKGKEKASSATRGRAPIKYRGTVHCLLSVLKHEGVEGLYRGMSVKMVQTVLMTAFHMTAYEKIVKFVLAILLPSKAKSKHQ